MKNEKCFVKVITEKGLGIVENWLENPYQTVVVKFFPSKEGKIIWLEKPTKFLRKEVFPLTDYALVRIINITGLGILSNLQFYDSELSAKEIFNCPHPNNEILLLLNLGSLTFQVNYDLGLAIGNYLWLNPRIDKWDLEKTGYTLGYINEDEPTLDKFDSWKEETEGTLNGGLFSAIFLNIPNKKIIRFCIVGPKPKGIIYESL